jgi:glycosyltransferase involved in cell wall biosynthesis
MTCSDTTPLISVVMSVHNGEKFLREAVESILNQTFRDFEFIIIDDGSADGSKAILEEYAARGARVRLVSRENRGLTKSLNEGLALARGEFVARMDADDIALPERFQRQIEYLNNNSLIAALGTWVCFIDGQGVKMIEHHSAAHPAIIAWEFSMGNMVWHPTMMIRREWLEKVGNYDESFWVAQDFDLWSRIFRAGGRVAVLPEVLLHYRCGPQQISKNRIESQGHAVMRVMRTHLKWLTGTMADDNVIKCIWDLLGSGKDRNYDVSAKALKLVMKALQKSEKLFEDTPVQLLHEAAFSRLFQRAEGLIPGHSTMAFRCAFTAIRVCPQVVFQRDLYRKMGRLFLRAFPRINYIRKNFWPQPKGSLL